MWKGKVSPMLRLLTILSMPQTTVERSGLLCLLQHVEESPFYNFVHNLQIGQYIFLAFVIFLRGSVNYFV